MAIYINPQNIVTYNTIYTAGANSMYGQHFELPINANLSLGDKLEWKCAVWRNNYVNDWVEIQNIESTGNLPYMGSYKVHTLEFNNGNGYRSLTNKNFYTNYITANSARLFVFDFNGDYSGNITKFTNEYANDRSVSCAYSYIKVIDSNDNIKECWIPAINNNIIGMYDTISKRFIPIVSDSYTQGLATVEGVISEIINGSISYLAYATSNNQLVYPKRLYWANSRNSVQLVYVRPVKELHIISPSFYQRFKTYVTNISEIILTSHIPNASEVVDNKIVNITNDNNNNFVKTYMWLTEDTNNVGKYIGYIGSPWYDNENSKFYCHLSMEGCFRDLKVNDLQHIVSKIDTSNIVSNFYSVFKNCSNITSLDLRHFDVSQGVYFDSFFESCSNLQSIKLNNWNTSNMRSIYGMFYGCSKLSNLDLSHFSTNKLTTISYLFYGCSQLVSLDVSTWDTSKVTRMNWVFNGCSFKRLDLSNWTTILVTDFSRMLNCANLVTIIANTFDTSSMEPDTDIAMFQNSTKLVGGNGTTYSPTNINSTYARIDGENGLPGYFTDPSTQAKITLMNSKNDGLKYLDYITINSTYTIPTLEGYTAVVTDNNGNTYSDGDIITITQNITLTFVWSAVNNNE